MSAPRLTPGGLSQLGPINWVIWRVLSKIAGTPDAHLFSALGRQRKLFRAWLRFSGQLMPGGSIPKHETELVILRVAHLRQCQYELDHHRRIGRRFGVTSELVERVFAGPTASGWSDEHRSLLTAVDALVRDQNLDDATWNRLRAHYSEAQCVELCLLVGQYEMLATTIHALRIPRDF